MILDDPRTELTDCTNCGTSDWDCLDGINRVNGRHCCGMCGLAPVHAGTAPISHRQADLEQEIVSAAVSGDAEALREALGVEPAEAEESDA